MLPLSYTRPIADLRVGILKIHEKWGNYLDSHQFFFRSEKYLSQKFPIPETISLTIKGGTLPTSELLDKIFLLKPNEVITYQNIPIAGYYDVQEAFEINERKSIELSTLNIVTRPWDIFLKNGEEIRKDYSLLTNNRESEKLKDKHTITYGKHIFIEKGAAITAAILNASNGPIYIGKNVEIQEGAILRGPVTVNEGTTVNMGAKIRQNTTIGPYSKVGGEISNSIIQGFSSKFHDGFLGNSVIGEWCNLGANTNISNLKNNYLNVKMWDYAKEKFVHTGLQFCGLIMADHTKCGINTMFNTSTSVGVCSNIFGEGFPRTFIPSFAWGGHSGFMTHELKKVFETTELVMQRKEKELTNVDKKILSHIFELTANYRLWKK